MKYVYPTNNIFERKPHSSCQFLCTTHHNCGFSIIDPADDYVGAPEVPSERECQAHPARRQDLELERREGRRSVSKH